MPVKVVAERVPRTVELVSARVTEKVSPMSRSLTARRKGETGPASVMEAVASEAFATGRSLTDLKFIVGVSDGALSEVLSRTATVRPKV